MSITYDARTVSTHAGHGSPLSPFTAATNWFQSLVSQYEEYRARHAAFSAMLNLSDSMLEDIGMSKADIRRAESLPLHVNASLELRKLAASRR